MAEEKTESKSGIVGPAGYNGGSGPSGDALQAPTKIYPNSSTIGKNASKDGGFIEGPASGKNTDKAGK
jgi:hypothetical protein